IAAEMAVAVEKGLQRTLGGIPVTFGKMPPTGIPKPECGKRKGNRIDITRRNSGHLETIAGGMIRPLALGMFVAQESLFLRRGDETAVDKKRGGWIMRE
ncbi:MAG: hypothetical protein V2I40_16780, partial [Desulfobacteraceae bacterium]|nr:hypothetical protein [Desulfobacteraceae bacterium]